MTGKRETGKNAFINNNSLRNSYFWGVDVRPCFKRYFYKFSEYREHFLRQA